MSFAAGSSHLTVFQLSPSFAVLVQFASFFPTMSSLQSHSVIPVVHHSVVMYSGDVLSSLPFCFLCELSLSRCSFVCVLWLVLFVCCLLMMIRLTLSLSKNVFRCRIKIFFLPLLLLEKICLASYVIAGKAPLVKDFAL